MNISKLSGYRAFALTAGVVLASAAVHAQGVTAHQQGQGGSAVQGSVGTTGSAGDNGLEHCDAPMGAVAVVEPQTHVLHALGRYRLGSPTGLIRLMIQQSNCFIVVERGVGLRNAMQERSLASRGELRDDSNVGRGQMMTADFILTPSVVFSENRAGGVGGAVGGLLGSRAGAIAGGLRFKEAQTSMLLADARTTVQVAAAEGSTRKADLRLGAGVFGGRLGAAAGGYGNTNEGKVISAALLDNYNSVVTAVRNDPSLRRNVASLAQEAASGGESRAGAGFAEGDVLKPKIANIKLLAEPADDANAVSTLSRNDELVVISGEKNGFVNVQGSSAAGWVKLVLVSKQ